MSFPVQKRSNSPFHFAVLLLGLCCWAVCHEGAIAAETSPTYDKDVRPILSQFCFKCHGPDDGQRQAGLRLDTKEGATSPVDSGHTAIVPGNVDKSELVRRILSEDAEIRMPPPSTKFMLTDAQKATLKQWVDSGATYAAHWAFVPPTRPAIPVVAGNIHPSALHSPIDDFILSRLNAAQLTPSLPADRYTLIRRASLDLIGLPPTPEEADEFIGTASPDAYERLLDRLLASPHYGERWGRKWLDLARYADTNGYEKDRKRTMWPYRDWVINAINADVPYDQFTIEQLAGDMLPDASIDQRIATGFHRNTMLNEEGGIDPLEFRFYAMTDRVSTTATTWLGLTLGCAQCHTHKYDPITHRDYYGFFALLNNADEPEMEIVRPTLASRRVEIQREIAKLEADLPSHFPLPDEYEWHPAKPISVASSKGAKMEVKSDLSVLVSGDNPDAELYLIHLEETLSDVTAIRLEALTDPSLPNTGPGRTPHGNFVLSRISIAEYDADRPSESHPLKLVRATADFSQKNYPVEKAIEGDAGAKTGWAIATETGRLNVDRTACFFLGKTAKSDFAKPRLIVSLAHEFGSQHTLGRFRLSLGRLRPTGGLSEEERRKAHFAEKYHQWRTREKERLATWTPLQPVSATSNLPLLTIHEDGSILASGDQSKRDIYEVGLANTLHRVTALRIEVLPDPALPKNGPGRVFYEGPFGDFFLSEVSLASQGQQIKLAHASHSFANGPGAPACLDGNQQTGWSIDGGQGKPHVAVFRFEHPVTDVKQFDLTLLFEKYYAAGLGRFRVSVTDDSRDIEASPLPTNLEALIRQSTADDAQSPELIRFFCSIAPELANERKPIDELRKQAMSATTALVMSERPVNNPRQTFRYHRGEFLQPREPVAPAGLSMLSPIRSDQPVNRLSLAKWLVSAENPLSARVTVNRHWSALFGRGIVRTTEDFGSQGASPTHPELLDWLAMQLSGVAEEGQIDANRSPLSWSIKRLHRLLASSATYRQSSNVSPELLAKDPSNELLARGPRFRLEAELIRDLVLKISGVLSEKLGGPSVFPPQPASVTTEGTYGSLAWTVSTGEDRYRRSLYTFSKRTSPYAMFMTFDGPSGEACIARREVTNTPLQALTMLNDTVLVEGAQSLGFEFASRVEPDSEKLKYLFRRCVTRPPTTDEFPILQVFFQDQFARLEKKELDPIAIAGPGENAVHRAAYTLVARALLNLDETITRD